MSNEKPLTFSKQGHKDQTFPSCAAAAQALGVTREYLSRAIPKGWKVKGWTIVQDARPEPNPLSDVERSMIYAFLEKHPQLVAEFKGKKEILAPAPVISEQLDYIKDITSKNGNVLYFSCVHVPFMAKGYFDFLRRTQDKYKCEDVVCLGDLVDNAATSRHGGDPDGLSPGMEFQCAYDSIQALIKAFPNLYLTPGNHDARPSRMAKKENISNRWIKSLKEAFDMPDTWRVAYRIFIDGVQACHGDVVGGLYPAANLAQKNRQSTVAGHAHSVAMVYAVESHQDQIWGLNVGCGIDVEKYSFAYAKDQPKRPILACGVVTDYGKQPHVILM